MANPSDNTSATRLYDAAERYILELITGPPSPDPETPPEVIRRRAIERLNRMRNFLAFIGDPQRTFRAIHIGGTSGKGSTATMTASILTAAGYRTGLHVSPYLQVATEKLMVDNKIASAARYHELVLQLASQSEKWVASGEPPLSYGEFWVALTFLYFAEENVDVGVVEVGAGGRFDLTNVIEPEVVGITSIGLDHVATLGGTLEEIAWHKAGIIKPDTIAVTAVDEPSSLTVIRDEAQQVGARLVELKPGRSYRMSSTSAAGTTLYDRPSGTTFSVPLAGQFQAANAATAIALVREFDRERFDISAIQRGLETTRFPGRMEIVQNEPLVLLDGAHNPQKISGLAADIRNVTGGRRLIGVFGALDSKNYIEMIHALTSRVDTMVATSPQVYAKPPVPAEEIASEARTKIDAVFVEPEPLNAIQRAIDLASPDHAIVVTGSLYLIGNVRERWYPSEKILSQGTMWPVS
jgi:dihydrofolate synthase/folylpolyglutamate synthase